MYLVKIRVRKNICITRDELEDIGKERYGSEFSLGNSKGKTDAIRVALTHRLRDFVKFTRILDDGKTVDCKALAVPPKNTPRDTLHIQINVQEKWDNTVNYTSEVCTLKYTAETGITLTGGIDDYKYMDIINAIDYTTLCCFGKAHAFESDVRKLFADLTDKHTLKFWHGGTYVCLDDSAHKEVLKAADLLRYLTDDFEIYTITIDNSDENKKSVASELGESVFTKAFEDMTKRAEKPGANLERLEQDYSDLLEKIADVENWLGCTVDCQEAQEAFETALSELAIKDMA